MIFKNLACAALWLSCAASGTAASMFAGGAARADTLPDLYQALQSQPRDVALNLRYAAAAERAGKLKWALPAYERALGAAPGNEEARQGIARVRTRLRAEANRDPARNDTP